MSHRIIIYDADPIESVALRMSLDRDERVIPVTVSSGLEMVELMDADPADLILSDLEMPDRDALQTLVDIRRRHPDCLVLVQTAFPGVATAVRALRAGMTDYIVKPCPPDEILARVDHAISRLKDKRSTIDDDKKEFLRQIAASINHEVNNPLTAIMGTAELMLAENQQLSPKARHDLETIIEQSLRIREVTCRLRELPEIRTTRYVAWDNMIDLRSPDAIAAEEELPFEGLARRRIAVVDDNALMVSMLRRMLGSIYEIVGYSNAADFLAAISDGHVPDVALVEMRLPDMEVTELVEAIHRIRGSLPVVLLAAYQDDEKIAAARRNGALGPLYKPVYSEELKKMVQDVAVPPAAQESPRGGFPKPK